MVGLVLRDAAITIAFGVTIGALASLWVGRFLGALLYAVKPRDPATLVAAAALLAFAGAIAAWLPALRAARVEPAITLRAE